MRKRGQRIFVVAALMTFMVWRRKTRPIRKMKNGTIR
jgi:hypothetical protein